MASKPNYYSATGVMREVVFDRWRVELVLEIVGEEGFVVEVCQKDVLTSVPSPLWLWTRTRVLLVRSHSHFRC